MSSITRAGAGSSPILQRAQKTREATGYDQGWLSSQGDQVYRDRLTTFLILAVLFILLAGGLGVPLALGLSVPRTLRERPTPRLLLLWDAPLLSLRQAILILRQAVLVLRLTVLILRLTILILRLTILVLRCPLLIPHGGLS